MGKLIYKNLIILISGLILTSVFIYWNPYTTAVKKKVPLSEALSHIKGWKNHGFTSLAPQIVATLELDDYANYHYSNGNETVSLYVGYYLTQKKIGAAHDPIVCFPGQGWLLSDIFRMKYTLNRKTDDHISYSFMTAQLNMQREFIIYWFQSYDKTNPDTFSQKIVSLWKKIHNQREDNAFIRISTPIGNRSSVEAHETIQKFIRSFYPVFLKYITD